MDGLQHAGVEFLQHHRQPPGHQVVPGVEERQPGQAHALQGQLAHHVAVVHPHHLADTDLHTPPAHVERPVRDGALVVPAQAHMAVQIVRAAGPAMACQVARRPDDHLPGAAQQARHHVGRGQLAPADRHVDALLRQVHHLVGEIQVQAQPGVGVQQRPHQRHQQPRARGRAGADTHDPPGGAAGGHRSLDLVQVGQHPLATLVQLGTFRRELHTPGAALQELHTQARLQPRHGFADCRG